MKGGWMGDRGEIGSLIDWKGGNEFVAVTMCFDEGRGWFR